MGTVTSCSPFAPTPQLPAPKHTVSAVQVSAPDSARGKYVDRAYTLVFSWGVELPRVISSSPTCGEVSFRKKRGCVQRPSATAASTSSGNSDRQIVEGTAKAASCGVTKHIAAVREVLAALLGRPKCVHGWAPRHQSARRLTLLHNCCQELECSRGCANPSHEGAASPVSVLQHELGRLCLVYIQGISWRNSKPICAEQVSFSKVAVLRLFDETHQRTPTESS